MPPRVSILLILLLGLVALGHCQKTLPQLESRAAALKARGDAKGALDAWEKAAALDPRSARIEDEIGFLLAVLNRREEANRPFKRAIGIDPSFAPAPYHLGVAFWMEQDPPDSIPSLGGA